MLTFLVFSRSVRVSFADVVRGLEASVFFAAGSRIDIKDRMCIKECGVE